MSHALDSFLARHPGRDLDRGGIRLHYLDEGAGDPVVMVHGNPTWSFYYRNLVEALIGRLPDDRPSITSAAGCPTSRGTTDTLIR